MGEGRKKGEGQAEGIEKTSGGKMGIGGKGKEGIEKGVWSFELEEEPG